MDEPKRDPPSPVVDAWAKERAKYEHAHLCFGCLKELVAATEDYVSSDPDMPSHAEAEARYERAMSAAQAALSDSP